jgi:hypothetical protein
MLLLILGLLLFTAITWINLLWWLFRILLFFLLLSFIWFLIKSGFYILVFFAVVYLWIKWIAYLRSYVKWNNKSEYKKSRRVSFDDADFVEVVE